MCMVVWIQNTAASRRGANCPSHQVAPNDLTWVNTLDDALSVKMEIAASFSSGDNWGVGRKWKVNN